jgi:hypothetical protein
MNFEKSQKQEHGLNGFDGSDGSDGYALLAGEKQEGKSSIDSGTAL